MYVPPIIASPQVRGVPTGRRFAYGKIGAIMSPANSSEVMNATTSDLLSASTMHRRDGTRNLVWSHCPGGDCASDDS